MRRLPPRLAQGGLMDAPSMLDPVTLAPAVRWDDPDTCRTAAERASVNAGTNRALALTAHAHADGGLTDHELAELTGVQQTSIGKRRGELVALGLIERTDVRRPSPTGSPAIVWRITAVGLDHARQVAA
jgi:hypothetical protein